MSDPDLRELERQVIRPVARRFRCPDNLRDDLTQEAWIAVLTRLADHPDSSRALLFTIARRHCIDWLRTHGPHRRQRDDRSRTVHHVSLDELYTADEPSTVEVEYDRVESSVDATLILERTTRLTDRERAVIRGYFYDGRTLASIGAEHGVGESRACQILGGAVRKLRATAGVKTERPRSYRTAATGKPRYTNWRYRGAAA